MCYCQESRISAVDARGCSYTARLSWRCAEHAKALRAADVARDKAVARWFAAASSLQRALPAPPMLLAYTPVAP